MLVFATQKVKHVLLGDTTSLTVFTITFF